MQWTRRSLIALKTVFLFSAVFLGGCGDNRQPADQNGKRCETPAIAKPGLNKLTGVFNDYPEGVATCTDRAANAVWLKFTAHTGGRYEIIARNNTSTFVVSRLVVLDSASCAPFGEELLCNHVRSEEITGEVTLAEGQTVLIVFLTNSASYTMVDPEIEITRICDPLTEFTCNNKDCIPLQQLCDGTENCHDGSDEINCGPGERCMNPEVATLGLNSFTGDFADDPKEFVSCAFRSSHAVWATFTAPTAGLYGVFAENNTTTKAFSRLVILDGMDCAPYGEELFCGESKEKTIKGEMMLEEGQSVLIAFLSDGGEYTMVDPEIRIWEFCEPGEELTCDIGGCFPMSELCDGVENCGDGSDEVRCEPGQRCGNPAVAKKGVNAFTGSFDNVAENIGTCLSRRGNSIYLEFTAPHDGDYRIYSEYDTKDHTHTDLVVLNSGACSRFVEELLCSSSGFTTSEREITLTAGQTVLIVVMRTSFWINPEVINPVIWITDPCDTGREFTCDSGDCIPMTKLCDGIQDCADGSDETTCEPGDRCVTPAEVNPGVNSFTGTFHDNTMGAFTCHNNPTNGIWAQFTAPAEGTYGIRVRNNTSINEYSRLAILDSTDCSTDRKELLCTGSWRSEITVEVTLTAGQTVLIAFMTKDKDIAMKDPEITLWELCNPATEFTCDNGDCIPVSQLCDGVSNCADGSDETRCKPGDLCLIAAEVHLGENSFTGVFEDEPEGLPSCGYDTAGAIWLQFTAPATGSYTILAENGHNFTNSMMVVLDGTSCHPYGDELFCGAEYGSYIYGEVELAEDQAVLIVFFAGLEMDPIMLDPKITIAQQ